MNFRVSTGILLSMTLRLIMRREGQELGMICKGGRESGKIIEGGGLQVAVETGEQAGMITRGAILFTGIELPFSSFFIEYLFFTVFSSKKLVIF